MDKLSVHGSSSKQAKYRKKPVKVVYISNPMKVKTSASEFRSLVQELTGRDSCYEDALKYVDEDQSPRTVPNPPTNDLSQNVVQEVPRADPYDEAIRSLDSTFEQFEAFSPSLIDNFNALTPSTGLL
ncbi:hypothetical protein ACHQM5_012828 [Ranunculus cassubicifolius]